MKIGHGECIIRLLKSITKLYTKLMTSDAKRTTMEHTCSMILQHLLLVPKLTLV